MSREDPLKAEKDFSATLDEQLPLLEQLPDYKEALDKYLVLEKQIRQSSDLPSSKRIIGRIVDTLVDHADWEHLEELVTSLSKKHGQMKTAIQVMIQQVIKHLSKLKDSDEKQLKQKISLIETIRTITDKKIFVEVERAEVSRMLSDIYLAQGDLDKATEILCDLQVETYSMMPFDTKVEYILQQMALTLQKHDFAQAKVLSRKILLKTLQNFAKAEEYKATYLRYLLQINAYEKDYITSVKNSLLLMELPAVKDSADYKDLLISIVYTIILSPYDNYQSDLIHKIKANTVFSKNVSAKVFRLLEIFTTNEIIRWGQLEADYSDLFAQSPMFLENDENTKNLQKRVIEHNLRIISKYYSFIELKRVATLLQLDVADAETHISTLVNLGMISGKINRPQGIVKFEKHGVASSGLSANNSEDMNELLNNWVYDIDKLLEEVDSIGHLINKEEMMYGIKQKL